MTDDMGPLPAIHPRFFTVEKAKLDLAKRILDWRLAHQDLTDIEMLKCIAEATAEQSGNILRYMLRAERHGTTDKKGDEA